MHNALLNVYSRFNLNFERGKGIYLYDIHGDEYLDFVSGVAVNCLGHAHPVIANTLKQQGEKLIHISNLYCSPSQLKLARKLTEHTEMDKVFFTNSGTEANELAIKIARKFGNNIHPDKTEVIYMSNSFHGRSTGALAITGQAKYQQPFAPLMPNTVECRFNDIADFTQKINANTCAVILEPIQGESGLEIASAAFMQNIQQQCAQFNALLIFDEIQCGLGRTGLLFAYQHLGIKPDVVTIAKALGGGIPIGACLTHSYANDVLQPGDHGSTYGGNPLVCEVAHSVLTELIDHGVIDKVAELGDYAHRGLQQLKQDYPIVTDIRGKGLLLGFKLDETRLSTRDFVLKAIEHKLLLVGAGNNVVRYLPPLNVTKAEIDLSMQRLNQILQAVSA